MTALKRFEDIPPGLLDAGPEELLGLLGGPALLHLRSGPDASPKRSGALFVSVLLHGNETSGWYAVRELLRDNRAPSRDLLILIGNVEAAACGVRTLPGQPDFNRIWQEPEGIAVDVLRYAAEIPLLAVVDLHNNTGRNPHYSVLADFSAGSRGLAALFGDTAVFIEEPATVLTRAFSPHTPNVALELGPVTDTMAARRGYEYLRCLIQLDAIPQARSGNARLFRTLARVHLREGARFAFANRESGSVRADWLRAAATGKPDVAPPGGIDDLDLVLDDAIEASNFARLPAGTLFGVTVDGQAPVVLDNSHKNVTNRFFEVRGGRIALRHPTVPAMYTTDPNVVRQDCLCYFMEPMDLGDGAPRDRTS
ncbi:MAG: succinylglutamate desuccinylase/aspartoacylase family protein [Gammaproteobacteria bacterium]|nr:succinylglutamate desuccinylase/aspartoacylase family protein [Gammaproteobacteria bacterium]